MPIEDTIRAEKASLRTELQELKRCQLQYFLLSAGGSGLLVGLNNVFPINSDARPIALLAPLLIVIPCWWTFFDKATTITRLAGYIGWLEEQLSSEAPRYIGYETALTRFRKTERTSPPTTTVSLRDWRKWPSLLSLLVLRTRHRYWMINWYTFLLLSSLCCVLPLLSGVNPNPWLDPRASLIWIAASFVVVSALYNLRVIADLVIGRYNYAIVQEYWRSKVLP